jgi:RNA polymerase sigma factor (sigma-70 family)
VVSMLQQTVLETVGEPGAAPPTWDQVVAGHSTKVYRHALRLTGNRADAEDLTQDVFLRVFRSLDSYVPGTFDGWLHRITTNLFLDQVRRKARIRLDPAGDGIDSSVVSAPAAHDLALDRLFDPDVEAALADLAPEFRAAVLLADVDGLSYEEVADRLGLKLGTVRSRIHRGRSKLRRALAHRAPGVGRQRYAGPLDAARGSTPLAVGG